MMRSVLGYLALAGSSLLVPGADAASQDQELDLISQRRIADLAQFPDPPWFNQISTWLASQKSDGTWSDVNYASGCAARKLAHLVHFPRGEVRRLIDSSQNVPIGLFKPIGTE
jgi:hypothetical protein